MHPASVLLSLSFSLLSLSFFSSVSVFTFSVTLSSSLLPLPLHLFLHHLCLYLASSFPHPLPRATCIFPSFLTLPRPTYLSIYINIYHEIQKYIKTHTFKNRKQLRKEKKKKEKRLLLLHFRLLDRKGINKLKVKELFPPLKHLLFLSSKVVSLVQHTLIHITL